MNQVTAQTHQLVVIDSQVNNYQSLVSDVGNDSTVLILDSSSDGLRQISDYLTTLPSKAFQSIHIISHGGVGSLLLGSSTVNGSNLSSYSKQLSTIGNALTENGDILLYGCNVAAGQTGQAFIEDLAGFTGADVAASDDLTGAAGLGGDWLLEQTVGLVDAAPVLNATTAGNYEYVLDLVPGQAEIDLGAAYGKLILPVNVDGNWYYYWDRTGDGTSANTQGAGYTNTADNTTHDVLDGIFTQDINGNTGGGGNTDDTYRYTTLNGVKLALPTLGETVVTTGYRPGTAIDNVPAGETNATYDDMLAIWDAYNGTGTETGYAYGTPSGWYNYSYWSATPSTSGHANLSLAGYVYDKVDSISIGGYVALQVLFPANNAPTASNNTLTTLEDTAKIFTAADFNFQDVDSGAALASIKITNVANAGALEYYNGSAWVYAVIDQIISKADLDAGKLRFTPTTNVNGAANASFGFKVNDGTVDSTSTYTMTMDVTAVNDAPTLTTFSSVVTNGNQNSETTVSFANLQSQGNEADVDGSVTAFVVKAVSSGMLKIGLSAATATAWNASTNNIIDATHQAYWTPAANANGALSAFTAVAKDNGGVESSTPVQATVGVIAAGQSVINLGADYGKLILPVNVDGNWYYYWDRSGDGTSENTQGVGYTNTTDKTSHDVLDGIFTQDINGTTGGGNTDNTYRYATLNGVLVALPTLGDTVTTLGYRPGTVVGGTPSSVGNTANNPTYDDMLAIWDAYNGTGTEINISGTPSSWSGAYSSYWSATPSTSGHPLVGLYDGYVFDSSDVSYAPVALQVLFSDTTAPTLSSSSPTDNATAVAVSSNIALIFNESVQTGSGNIVISNGTDTRTIAVTDTSQVTINGSTVTINPTLDLNAGSNYNVQIASGVIKDLAGNAYAGITDATTLNFTTLDTQAPTLTTSTPADNTTAVAVNSNIILTFSEPVQAGAGNILISNGTDTRTIYVADTSQVTINGSAVTINPTLDLNAGGNYNVQMASGVLKDLAGNPYAGISDTTTLNFTTLDTQAPTLLSSTPTDNATAVAVSSNIALIFNESVQAGAGNILISNGTDTRTIYVADTSQVTINGSAVTINPTLDLNAGVNYNVQMVSGVLKDLAGNAYAGITDATTLNFTTLDTQVPTLTTSTPADNTTAVALSSNIVLTFNEPVQAGVGNILISNGTDTRTLYVADTTQVTINGSTVTINPTLDLIAGGNYNVQMASGVLKDLAGNAYVGISDTTTLNFTTLDTQAPILLSSTPTDNATAVALSSNIVLAFNESVQANTGNIVISNGTDTRTITVTDTSQVTINGSTVTINPTLDLIAGGHYNVQMASGVIKDLAGNVYTGISNVTTLNFSTVAPTNILPTATNLNQNIIYTEDTIAAIADLVVSDPDINIFTATVSLASANSRIGSLTANSSNGETFNAATGVWTVTGTRAAVNTALASLSFVPAANSHDNTSASVSISDGIAPAITGTLTFNGTAVNDAPTGTDNNITTLEDTAFIFTAANFGFVDINDNPAHSLANVLMTSLPTVGSLQLNGIAVTVNQAISAANINSGLLKFVPPEDANGSNYTNFNFKVQDNGGTINSGVDTSVSGNTLTINVTAVNDEPTGIVTITGTPTQGQTLTAGNTLVDADGLGPMSYTWKTGTTVLGSDNTYTIAQGDVGKTITATASYTDLQGTLESKSSVATVAVGPATPAFIITKDDLVTGEDGDTAIISVQLATAPTQNVSITFTSSDLTEGTITHPTLIFTSTNWQTAQNFTVVGQNDYLRDGNQLISINAVINSNDVDYRQILIDPIGITNKEDVTTDNDARIPLGTVRDKPLKIYGDAIVDTSIIDATTGLFKVTGTLNVNDHLHGLDGNDTLYGKDLQDELSGGIGNDTLYGGNDQDFLYGQDGNDYLWGEQDADDLEGGAGNDTLDGGLGLDTLIGGTGNDTYYLGYDAVDFIDDQGLAADVDIIIMPYLLTRYTLPTSIENGTIAAGTAASSLTGNSSNNILTGNDGKNTLDGAVGRDSLFGGAGNDALLGGEDNDALAGGVGADHLEGGNGNDSVNGGNGNDEIVGGSGAGDDIYIGGLGIDTVIYTSAIADISVNLALGTASGTDINNDKLSGIENIVGGQAGDFLTGNISKNALEGFTGNDTISGGAGKDTLTGGLGADQFMFNSETETGPTGATRDIIADFNHAQGDKVNLSALDANKTTSDNDAFSILTVGGTFSGAFTGPGRLYFDKIGHVLYGNNDADSAADFSIQLTGVSSLTVADVVL